MKTTPRSLSALSLALLAGLFVAASPLVHGQINYQGRLTDATGAALVNGPTDISFSLYDSITGGTKLWGPYNLNADLVDGGRFNAVIGNLDTGGNSLTTAMAASTTHYLEITVAGDAPISPRQVILASPRALKADVIPNITPNGANTSITGNVGIGTGAPKDSLHILGVTPEIRLSNTSETYSGIVFEDAQAPEDGSAVTPVQFAAIRFDSGSQRMGFFMRDSATPKVSLDNAGNVGIGTAGPAKKLHVFQGASGQPADWSATVLIENNSHNYLQLSSPDGRRSGILFGRNGTSADGFIEYDTDRSMDFRVAGADRMKIAASGNVGIGTATPTRGKLDVAGFQSHTYNIGGFLNRNGASDLNNTNLTRNVGIYSDNIIVAVEIHANSDARIKNILGRSDGAADLADLNRIEITNYTHKDVIERGDAVYKKVIAQQVEKILPQAVNQQVNVVPDIYRKAEVQDGWVKLATNLKKGERVRLIGDQKEAIHEVLEVAQDSFRVDFVPDAKTVFVYGREVNDFRTVDYDALSMLNLSATQELARQLKTSQENLAKLQQENTALKTQLAHQAAKDQALEARLTRLEQSAPRAAAATQVSMKK